MPITIVPYGGDDLVNRNLALKSWGAAFTECLDLVQQWMHNEGRFFPTAAGYGLVVWETFTSRASYTAYLAILAIVLGCAVAGAIWRYTGRVDAAVVAAFAFACGVQFRFFYDGFTSFAGLVPFSLLLTVCATACAYVVWRGRSGWLSIPAAATWILAITAYEVSLLMLPAMLVLIAVRRAASWHARLLAVASLALPTIVDLAIVFWLRSHLSAPPAPGYTIAVSTATPRTIMSQFVGAIPLSQHLFGIASPNLPLVTSVGIVLGLILVAVAVVTLRRHPSESFGATRQHPAALAIAGAWAWIIPSLLAGVTSRWQTELPLNQGYIYVVYESTGVCLIAVAAYVALTGRVSDPFCRRLALVIVILLAVAAAFTAGTNLDLARHLAPGPEGPDWSAAIGGPA